MATFIWAKLDLEAVIRRAYRKTNLCRYRKILKIEKFLEKKAADT